MRRLIWLTLAVAAAGIVLLVAAFNLWMPRGYHFMVAVNQNNFEIANAESAGGELAGGKLGSLARMADATTFRPLSRQLMKLGNQCDVAFFRDGERHNGKNGAIGMYVQFYKYIPATDNNLVLSYLEDALRQCDPNLKSADQKFPPLFYAIFLKHADLVSLLLRSGAKTGLRVSNPGKPTDGMNALEFARLLESRAKDGDARKAYAEIAALIEQHNAAALGQTSSTASSFPIDKPN